MSSSDLVATQRGVGVHELLAVPRWQAVPTAYTIGVVDPAVAGRGIAPAAM
ncbi:MAG: hypothetical protein ACRDUV_23415 [Pseudonocardiaceae bacterium]